MAAGPNPFEDVQDTQDAQGLAAAWDEIRADTELQFAPVEMPEQAQTPDWLIALSEFLAELFAPISAFGAQYWHIIWPVLAAIAIGLFLFMAWKIYGPDILARKKRSKGGTSEEDEWVPETGEAIALLKDADALAAQGRYDEATHLLLGRSVAQINQARPELIEPSSTAREIALLPALPDAARSAFDTIANRVEHSLFALQALGQDDWIIARAAYADFAKLGSQIGIRASAQTASQTAEPASA